MSLPPPSPTTAALVTGSSSGLGVELARALARRGFPVLLVARRAELLTEVAQDIAASCGVRAEPLACDLADADARERLLSDVAGLDLEIGVLVNNAGVAASGRFHELPDGVARRIAQVNVEAVVDLTARLVPAMVQRGAGGVLNVASTTAFQPMAGNGTYAASKAFVLSFTEALHQDLAGTGVQASALCPGPVKTELWEQAGAADVEDTLPGFLWTQADAVAEEGVRGLERGKRVVVPGFFNRASALSGQHAPRSVVLRLSGLLGGAGGH